MPVVKYNLSQFTTSLVLRNAIEFFYDIFFFLDFFLAIVCKFSN